MLSLKGRKDLFKIVLPKDFIPPHIYEKYNKILIENGGFIQDPIEYLNESIQAVEVLGFNNASVLQSQQYKASSEKRNTLSTYPASDVAYRAVSNPISLIDKTINITFKHTLGYINYFMILESFFYFYSREAKYEEFPQEIYIDIYNDRGSCYFELAIQHPIIDGLDMLSFDFSQPVAQSATFNLILKYSNLDYRFIERETKDYNEEIE